MDSRCRCWLVSSLELDGCEHAKRGVASLAVVEVFGCSGLLERVGCDGFGAGPADGHVGAVAGELGEIDEARPVAGR